MDMKSISQKLQDDIRAIMEAGLHPNQQKIDVHEPEKDKITAHDFKKLRTMKKTPDGKVHNCATHVEHVVLGKGTTVSEDHAEPDAEGNIEWYTVQFEHSTQKVLTKDLTITMSEAHMHESEEEQIQELAGKAAQQAAIAISLIKAGKKDGKMPKPMKEEEEKKKVVSPFDYKNYTSQVPKKPGELTGHDSKKISTGTVYTKKPVKEGTQIDELSKKTLGSYVRKNVRHQADLAYNHGEDPDDYQTDPNNQRTGQNRETGLVKAVKRLTKEEADQHEYTFADYLEAARAQYVDEDAVLVANEAFKNKDITLFIDQSQSPEA